MQLLVVTACLLLVVKMSEGAVAVGVGRLNPGENPSISAYASSVRPEKFHPYASWDKIKTHRILRLSYFAHVDKFAGRVVG